MSARATADRRPMPRAAGSGSRRSDACRRRSVDPESRSSNETEEVDKHPGRRSPDASMTAERVVRRQVWTRSISRRGEHEWASAVRRPVGGLSRQPGPLVWVLRSLPPAAQAGHGRAQHHQATHEGGSASATPAREPAVEAPGGAGPVQRPLRLADCPADRGLRQRPASTSARSTEHLDARWVRYSASPLRSSGGAVPSAASAAASARRGTRSQRRLDRRGPHRGLHPC